MDDFEWYQPGELLPRKAAHLDKQTNDWPLMLSRQVLIVKTLLGALNLAASARLAVSHLGHHRLVTFQKCIRLLQSLYLFQLHDCHHLLMNPTSLCFQTHFLLNNTRVSVPNRSLYILYDLEVSRHLSENNSTLNYLKRLRTN